MVDVGAPTSYESIAVILESSKEDKRSRKVFVASAGDTFTYRDHGSCLLFGRFATAIFVPYGYSDMAFHRHRGTVLMLRRS